jgi:hypothetical protein
VIGRHSSPEPLGGLLRQALAAMPIRAVSSGAAITTGRIERPPRSAASETDR